MIRRIACVSSGFAMEMDGYSHIGKNDTRTAIEATTLTAKTIATSTQHEREVARPTATISVAAVTTTMTGTTATMTTTDTQTLNLALATSKYNEQPTRVAHATGRLCFHQVRYCRLCCSSAWFLLPALLLS